MGEASAKSAAALQLPSIQFCVFSYLTLYHSTSFAISYMMPYLSDRPTYVIQFLIFLMPLLAILHATHPQAMSPMRVRGVSMKRGELL